MIAVIHGLSSTKTSPEFLLSKIKAWVEEYVHRYDSNDAAFQGNIDLKEHTRRVCEVIRDIAKSLHLSPKDRCLAQVSGLLHAIGRSEHTWHLDICSRNLVTDITRPSAPLRTKTGFSRGVRSGSRKIKRRKAVTPKINATLGMKAFSKKPIQTPIAAIIPMNGMTLCLTFIIVPLRK